MGARRSGGVAKRLLTCAAAAALATALSPLAQRPAAAGEHEGPFPMVATVSFRRPDGQLAFPPSLMAVDRDLRRLVAANATNLYLIDLDTLEQRGVPGTASAPTGVIPISGVTGFDQPVLALDDVGAEHRAFLGVAEPTGPPGTPRLPKVAVVGLTGDHTPPPPVVFPIDFVDHAIQALAYDAEREVLYALTASEAEVPFVTEPLVTQVALHALDASKLATQPEEALLWSVDVPSCARPLGAAGRPPFLGVVPAGDSVYFACRGVTVPPGPPARLHGAVVVEFDSADPANQDASRFETQFYPFGGDLTFGKSFGASAVDRLLIFAGGAGAQKLYAFDAPHRAWTGAVPFPQGDIVGGAVDPATGRVYAMQGAAQTFFRLFEGTPVPTTLGRAFTVAAPSVNAHPAFDPERRRLFVRMGGLEENGEARHLAVFEDRTPPFVVPAPIEPDSRTHDIDEAQAVDVAHGAAGSAFAAWALAVGGAAGAVGVDLDATLGDLKPQAGDRGVFMGEAEGQLTGNLSGASASASAVGARLDEPTRADLNDRSGAPQRPQPVPSDLWQLVGDNDNWPVPPADETIEENVGPFHPSSCRDFGGTPEHDGTTNANVACDAASGQASGRASTGEALAGAPFKVSYGESSVEAAKDAAHGTTAVVSSVVRGVDVTVPGGGSIYLGEVRARASTQAGGRPGTAESTYEVGVNDVRITDAAGENVFACGWATEAEDDDENGRCDVRDVIDAINRRFHLRVQAFGPRRDLRETITGSPGGAQAVVLEDEFAYWSALNLNFDDRHEVPAITLVVYNDRGTPSRYVLQLAAVEAESHYEIGEERRLVPPELAALVLDLRDTTGAPLAGGSFAVHRDLGGDGALGAADPLAGSCTTAADGIGSCRFADLTPGAYVIHQAKAPDGFLPADDFAQTLFEGQGATITFTNARVPRVSGGTASRGAGSGAAVPDEVIFEQVAEPVVSTTPAQGGPSLAEFVGRLPEVLGNALRLLARNLREALLLAAMWGLLGAPIWMHWKRRSLAGAVQRSAARAGT